MCLDEDGDAIARQSDQNPACDVTSDNLAYVIYTSGSTGKPKGSLICHRNVTRLFGATQPWFGFDQNDVWTLFHSFAFDFSVWEMWGALLYGGKLLIVSHLTSRSPEEFYELLKTERVTVLNQTPSAFYQLMAAEESRARGADEMALRLVIFGGEALDFGRLAPWFARHGDTQPQLVNMYGITETTVHVTYRPLTAADAEGAPASSIGVPIPDLQIYVLDGRMEPVPIGIVGEMYVGGGGLARGYLNRPELSAERFIRNPFSSAEGARLYRTGDLARFTSSGDLEYLGRADQQVKIRGFRIELGEIETVLLECPGMQQCVCVVREDQPGDKRLVAYFVIADGAQVQDGDLRKQAGAKLPAYMIPTSFVEIDALPLTPNGKVDRKALLALGGSSAVARVRIRGAAQRGRREDRRDLERGARGRARGRAQQLLRIGRQLPPDGSGHGKYPRRL